MKKLFEKRFHRAPETICFAPGRVNLIGEHTDYNGGHVFPCAIHLGVCCASAKRADRELHFYSENFPEDGERIYSLNALDNQGAWSDYPASVVRALEAFGYPLPQGADFVFNGDLPDGAGLSSSAAMEVATGVTLRELFGIPVTQQELALLGQFAENRFIGVNCGIMDQFASAMGRKKNAVLLDANTLSYQYAPLVHAALVIVNSGVRHSLASSAYNDRRRESDTACKVLNVPTLCSLSPEEFEKRKHLIQYDICRRRARHALYENRRVLDAVTLLNKGDLNGFGQLMNASHASLRDDYAVSCGELDFLAETAQGLDGVYGARMTGGGFGGCTVNLMEQDAVEAFVKSMRTAYQSRFGIIPAIYPVTICDGAGVMRNDF